MTWFWFLDQTLPEDHTSTLNETAKFYIFLKPVWIGFSVVYDPKKSSLIQKNNFSPGMMVSFPTIVCHEARP